MSNVARRSNWGDTTEVLRRPASFDLEIWLAKLRQQGGLSMYLSHHQAQRFDIEQDSIWLSPPESSPDAKSTIQLRAILNLNGEAHGLAEVVRWGLEGGGIDRMIVVTRLARNPREVARIRAVLGPNSPTDIRSQDHQSAMKLELNGTTGSRMDLVTVTHLGPGTTESIGPSASYVEHADILPVGLWAPHPNEVHSMLMHLSPAAMHLPPHIPLQR